MEYGALLERVPEKLAGITEFRTVGIKPLGKLAVGFGLAKEAGAEAAKFCQGGKVLLISDKTMVALGTEKIVSDSIRSAGLEVVLFDDVEPEPHLSTCRRVQDAVRSDRFEAVVGLGGGSPMDMAKTAAVTATNPGDIKDYLTGEPFEREGLPCILMPTTSGTGSEVSPYIVASEKDRKLFVGDPHVYATVALVDPLLTVTMPSKVTAATGLDALSHGMEGMIGKTVPVTEALTTKCVEYVFAYLPEAVENGMDLEARYYMSFASVFGMMSYTQGGGLYAHSMSYILTLEGGHAHGLGCGLALPYTFMFNFESMKESLLKLAPLVAPGATGSDDEVAEKVVCEFKNLVERVGMPSSLKDLGIEESRVGDYAKDLVETYYRVKNPRPMSPEEAVRFVRSMWEGTLVRI